MKEPRQRGIRTRPETGRVIGDLVQQVLVSELLSPGNEFWIVSGWLSDISVIDNVGNEYSDAVVGMPEGTRVRLSEVLTLLARANCQIHLALSEDSHNDYLINRLRGRVHPDMLHVYRAETLHEKTMCGRDWTMTGSMNFTRNGLERNEERVTFAVNGEDAARERVELRQRWIHP